MVISYQISPVFSVCLLLDIALLVKANVKQHKAFVHCQFSRLREHPNLSRNEVMSAIYIGSEIYRKSSFGYNHPLSYARQESVADMCRALGWLDVDNFIQSPIANITTLTRYHDHAYVSALKSCGASGSVPKNIREYYNFGTMENPLFTGIFDRAATTVGGSIEAAKQALKGHIAFHPSGGTHHGLKDKAHGFCYFNDPAFAILTLLDAGLERIAYVDIDAHHGDGVELAFLNDERVLTASIHEDNRWPYSGTLLDQGKARLNIPVPIGINDSEFKMLFDRVILSKIEKFQAQAIVVTCGTDALDHDPLSKMALSSNALWEAVLSLKRINLPLVVLGGGGYNPWTTIRTWVGLWGLLSNQTLPDSLPPAARDILNSFDSDLIDEEDRLADWTTTLMDKPNQGPIRDEIKALVERLA